MANIRELHGNIFDSMCKVIVNPVNCQGVMGKGLALQFKKRYPDMYQSYKKNCQKGLFKPGLLQLWTHSTPWILNFPTKVHWKNRTKLEYIEAGLQKFAATYKVKEIDSIAFPALGVGLGGLRWKKVRTVMYKYLEKLDNIDIEIYYDPFLQHRLQFLYYAFMIDNLESILKHGILSRNTVEKLKINFSSFANEAVLSHRFKKGVTLSRGQQVGICDLVPCYFVYATPTVKAVIRDSSEWHVLDKLCFALIDPKIVFTEGISFAFSDGNAASHETLFYTELDDLTKLPWEVIKGSIRKVSKYPDGMRKRNSEFLLYPQISIDKILEFNVNNDRNKIYVEKTLEKHNITSIQVKVNYNLEIAF